MKQEEEVTELVGLCLWDVFADSHDVGAADRSVADIGSCRGAGAFLDEYLTPDQEDRKEGDYMRFYSGTIWISQRADLTLVYAMIAAVAELDARSRRAEVERFREELRQENARAARKRWTARHLPRCARTGRCSGVIHGPASGMKTGAPMPFGHHVGVLE